jgi:hypothetical protein
MAQRQQNQDTPDFIEVQRHLAGVAYPAEKDDLIEAARDNDAPDHIMEILDDLDERVFEGPVEVTKAITRSD